MVQLYALNIANLPDPKTRPEVLQGLPVERVHKIARMKQNRSRRQSLGAGLLLENALSRYGYSSQDVYLDEHGKPQIEGLFFNLSHSGEIVVCAVSDEPVGCDVEECGKAPKHIAERFFCDNENRYLARFDSTEYDRQFYRLWTMKESYVKMTGEGIRLPFSSFELQFGSEVTVLREGKIESCYIKEYQTGEYHISVCAKEHEFADIITVLVDDGIVE